jgi:hypothetical protein
MKKGGAASAVSGHGIVHVFFLLVVSCCMTSALVHHAFSACTYVVVNVPLIDNASDALTPIGTTDEDL